MTLDRFDSYDINCELKQNDFVHKVTPQKKRARQLKYSIYTRVFQNNTDSQISDYIIIISDRFDIKKTIKGHTFLNKDYTEVYAILEAIKHIYNLVEDEYKKFINLKIFSNNIFITNFLREWIYIWANDKFEKCNLPLNIILILKDIYNYILEIKSDIFWITKTTDETTWFIYSKNSIEEF